MKIKGILVIAAASLLLAAGLSADQPFNVDQLPEDCALAAAPRALETFRWLNCAPESRSVWASSERARDPELVTTPRGRQQLPQLARARSLTPQFPKRIVLASNERFASYPYAALPAPVQRFSSLSRRATARGGASMLMDWTQ